MTSHDNIQKMKNYIENILKKEPYMLKTYKQKRTEFRRSFKDTNAEFSLLISDYSCAIYAGSPKILQQGRMYITVEYICFYSRILTFEQKIVINFKDISEITKEKTAMVFQNAIQIIKSDNEKLFFSSFTTRDRTYHVIYKLWRENKDGFKLSNAAFWDRVRENYGNDLGFITEDPELDESSATQFTARYRIPRRPSELVNNSSPDDSIYESLEESPINDSSSDYSNCNGNGLKLENLAKMHSSALKHVEEEIKFDIPFQSVLKENLEDTVEIKPEENCDKSLPAASCTRHEHYPVILMDEEFNINVSNLWSYIFTDHAFFRALCAMRLITDITQSSWSNDMELDKEVNRTIYYTVNLKNRIGPKKSPTVEKQVLLEGSIKNYIYYTESTVRTVGIPLSDSFHVLVRYCMLYINPNKSRIKVSMKIVYDKSVFFATKSIIDSSVKSGCIDYNKDLKQALLIESQKINYIPSEQKLYSPQTTIEDNYRAPTVDTKESDLLTTALTNTHNETQISWIVMVIICCISFLGLYIFKEYYSDSSKYLERNNNVKTSHKELDHDSLAEIMKIIKEMKNTIDILKLNIEMLNRSQNPS